MTAMQKVYNNIYEQFHNEKKLYNVMTVDVLTVIQEMGMEIEKKQIEQAFNYALKMRLGSESQINTGEDYYNEKFKK